MDMTQWIAKWWHMLPPDAQIEYAQIVQPFDYVTADEAGRSENAVQTDIILAASRDFRAPLWRNNNGAATHLNDDGSTRHVRFGLGNTSERVNKKWKSSDLIGIRPTLITPDLLGATLGVFTAVEVKKPGWSMRPSDKRAAAQSNFMSAVQSFGGRAGFAQSTDDLKRILT